MVAVAAAAVDDVRRLSDDVSSGLFCVCRRRRCSFGGWLLLLLLFEWDDPEGFDSVIAIAVEYIVLVNKWITTVKQYLHPHPKKTKTIRENRVSLLLDRDR
jgi:hypothetical protein